MFIFRSAIIVALCVGVFASFAQGQVDPVVTLSTDSQYVIAGDMFSVDVSISGGYDLAATYLELNADTSSITGSIPLSSNVPNSYVFGKPSANFISDLNTTANGYRWTISDIFDPDADGELSPRSEALNAGDLLGSFTIRTNPLFTGTLLLSLDASSLELLNTDAMNIAGFDNVIDNLDQPLAIQIIPEPASLIMLTAGAIAVIRKRS